MLMGRLDKQIALITGASKGIGKAIATGLAMEGAHVILVARSVEQLSSLKASLTSSGLKASIHVADISRQAQAEAMIGSAINDFGRLDILVNNAGIGFFKPLTEMPLEEFDAMWSVNVRAIFVAAKAALPYMIKARSGSIVNIGSLAGKNSFKGGAGYSATKWALRGLASSLMLEVREHNIRVVTIFPGSVDTDFSMAGKRGANIPQPEDVASAVVFAVTAPQRSMFSEIDLRPTNP